MWQGNTHRDSFNKPTPSQQPQLIVSCLEDNISAPTCFEELSDYIQRDDVSRASSCRSIIVNGEETPVWYWKDIIDTIIQQYCLEFPRGVKRTCIYTHLPPNVRRKPCWLAFATSVMNRAMRTLRIWWLLLRMLAKRPMLT